MTRSESRCCVMNGQLKSVKRYDSTLKFIGYLILIFLAGCTQEQDQQARDPQRSTTAVQRPAYQPHPAYAPSTTDPLKALYGGRDPNTPADHITPQALKVQFDKIKDQPLVSPLPRSWRGPLQALKKKLSIKVSSWAYLERTRMERGKRDQQIEITLKVWGPKKNVNREVLATLRSIKVLKALPSQWGDQHELMMKRKHTQVTSKRSASLADDHPTNPTVLATFTVDWSFNHPQPSGELKNCRYVHGLSPEIARGFPQWGSQHLKSVSTRRFVEYRYEINQEEELWRATWIYRNGVMHDLAIAWWVKKLEARGAKRITSQNLEQTWRLPRGGEISWWPETNPDPMGCEVAGGLINFEGRIPSSQLRE